MIVHFTFDVLAWSIALATRYACGRFMDVPAMPIPRELTGRYYMVALLGAGAGAMLLGTLNLALFVPQTLGHSILGGLLGGAIAIEYFKTQHGITASTGYGWVVPLSLGIAIGRLGCFFAGLPDNTYGTPTTLPWGVDFGDHVIRHPVQLYESLAMGLFALVAFVIMRRSPAWFRAYGFYLFALYYGAQRFVWEFLKPYPTVLGPFNLFHIMGLVLIAYGVAMILRNQRHDSA